MKELNNVIFGQFVADLKLNKIGFMVESAGAFNGHQHIQDYAPIDLSDIEETDEMKKTGTLKVIQQANADYEALKLLLDYINPEGEQIVNFEVIIRSYTILPIRQMEGDWSQNKDAKYTENYLLCESAAKNFKRIQWDYLPYKK